MVAAVAFALLAGGWVATTGRESGVHKLGRLHGEDVYEHYYRFGNMTTTCASLQNKSYYDAQGMDISYHHLYEIRQVCDATVKRLAAEQG